MMKKLLAEEKKDQENSDRKGENKNEIVLSSKSFAPHLPTISILKISTKLQYPKVDNGYLQDRTNFIFRPPKV
jgi:hypothetical protein